MKRKINLILTSIFFLSVAAMAQSSQLPLSTTHLDGYFQSHESTHRKQVIDSAVSDFFTQTNKNKAFSNPLTTAFQNFPHHPPVNCIPVQEGPSCADVACQKLGTFGCDTLDEIRAVGLACRGNFNGDCLFWSCQKLGQFGCDTLDEVRAVAKVCVGSFDSECIQSSCEKLGTFGCDTIQEIQEVGVVCKGVVGRDCIDQVCSKLGSFGCDTMDEIREVGKACGGQ